MPINNPPASGASLPYKKYVALINQNGTDPPTAIVLENDLPGSVVFTRIEAGAYAVTNAGNFPLGKTTVNFTTHYAPGSGGQFLTGAKYQSSNDSFLLILFDVIGNVQADSDGDAGLIYSYLEIRVYP